ncbi:unnamed protein product [Protopolystoma xenopodis]|uniref:Uncharacterized protein n=1 Tax=Protopolystoma xenopodis TaxID=117903 RepID=A0A3S5CFI1_9PLAT|nr:unnamed protein product [Protopolystoma xenopodis]
MTALERNLCLVDWIEITPEDSLLNQLTFTWPFRISSIVENSEAKLRRAKDEALGHLSALQTDLSERMDLLWIRAKRQQGLSRMQLSDANANVRELDQLRTMITNLAEEAS